jgi:UDP-N-acetylglucosamine--N-acetylmuramyl-(pentapeptide) pyrophosphoryl-undecaprenol N-acetylglucosamine transferase
VIAAGGTAGHVHPGIALAGALRRARPDIAISFVGTPRGIEGEALPAAGYPLHLIDVVPWARTLGAKRFLAPASLVGARRRARALLGSIAPAAVVGMGGYASLPVVLAARSRGLPTILHEQNAIPGLANMVGSRVARRVAVTFEEARSRFPRTTEVRVTGNPIRPEIALLDRGGRRAEAAAALALDPSRTTILVMGGSLGAARLNDAAAGLARLWSDRAGRQMLVVAGPAHGAELRERLAEETAGGLVVRCIDFLERIELAYAAADLALCRAGAATVTELAAVGLPAVLVPYPYARANHQEANARALEHAGGARVLLDREATPQAVAAVLEELLSDERALGDMSAAARRLGRPRAADDLAAWVLDVAEAPHG